MSAIAFVDRSGANDNTIDGTVTITGNTISDPERNAIMIETWAGTISNLNISNNTMSGGTTNARIQDAIHVFAQGTTGGITTGAISNNTIPDFRFFDTAPAIDIFIGGNGIRLVTDTNAVNPASTLGTSANPIVISGNDIDNVGSNMIAVTARRADRVGQCPHPEQRHACRPDDQRGGVGHFGVLRRQRHLQRARP